MFGIYVDAVAHNEASFGQESASIGVHPSQLRLRARLAILNGTGDRCFWLSAQALLELRTAGLQQEPLAIRDMRRVVNGERRSHAPKVLTGAFVP